MGQTRAGNGSVGEEKKGKGREDSRDCIIAGKREEYKGEKGNKGKEFKYMD